MFINIPSFEREERLAKNLRGLDPLVLDIGALQLEGSTTIDLSFYLPLLPTPNKGRRLSIVALLVCFSIELVSCACFFVFVSLFM